ncbi:MAG: hypothetical protein U0326_09685 [Polyangiales bacterium]
MTQSARSDAAPELPTRLVLIYRADAGVIPMIVDVLKKSVGIEECSLCHATFGATGMKRAWKACEQSLKVPVEHLHRNEVPPGWQVREEDLPCILVERAGARAVLVDRATIAACGGSPERLEDATRAALAREGIAA